MVPLHGVPARKDRVTVVITCSKSLGRLGLHQFGLMSIFFTGCSSPGPRRDDLTIYWALGPFVRSFTLLVDPGDIYPPQSQQRQKAHRTVNSDCPVHHQTVRWPSCQKLQRSEPNGRVTWLTHRTVSGGTPDCPVRHATEALTNGSFGGWGYKYPQPPHFNASKFSAFKHLTRAIAFNTRHNQRDQILSQVQRSFQSNSD